MNFNKLFIHFELLLYITTKIFQTLTFFGEKIIKFEFPYNHRVGVFYTQMYSNNPLKSNIWLKSSVSSERNVRLNSDKKHFKAETLLRRWVASVPVTQVLKSKVNFLSVNTGRDAHLPLEANWARLIFRCVGLATPPPQRACYLPSIADTHLYSWVEWSNYG